MIWWPEIASRLKEPHRSIPVHIEHQYDKVKKTADFDYYNDSNGPFGILYPDGTARFLSLEAEHTNQVATSLRPSRLGRIATSNCGGSCAPNHRQEGGKKWNRNFSV
jgi:hypothetical protein